MWAWVEGSSCRRRGILGHFGDHREPAPEGPCCDVCDPSLAPAPPPVAARRGTAGGARQLAQRPVAAGDVEALDEAIIEVVALARPALGRTRAVEVLRGGRSKVLLKHGWDGLPNYGAFGHMAGPAVLERVDALLEAGTIRSSGGHYPVLEAREVGRRAGGRVRVGVLASGDGSNLQAILDRLHGRGDVEVVAVGSDKAGARALRRAADAGVPARVFAAADFAGRPARDAAIADWLEERDVELVVLAGYMQLLDPAFLARFPQRVVNVHPALLPAFPGIGSVEQAVAYGVKVAGVTVHFVDEGVDTGPIIAQRAIDVPEGADAAALRLALRPLEHDLLPAVVGKLARGEVTVDPGNPRHVRVA